MNCPNNKEIMYKLNKIINECRENINGSINSESVFHKDIMYQLIDTNMDEFNKGMEKIYDNEEQNLKYLKMLDNKKTIVIVNRDNKLILNFNFVKNNNDELDNKLNKFYPCHNSSFVYFDIVNNKLKGIHFVIILNKERTNMKLMEQYLFILVTNLLLALSPLCDTNMIECMIDQYSDTELDYDNLMNKIHNSIIENTEFYTLADINTSTQFIIVDNKDNKNVEMSNEKVIYNMDKKISEIYIDMSALKSNLNKINKTIEEMYRRSKFLNDRLTISKTYDPFRLCL